MNCVVEFARAWIVYFRLTRATAKVLAITSNFFILRLRIKGMSDRQKNQSIYWINFEHWKSTKTRSIWNFCRSVQHCCSSLPLRSPIQHRMQFPKILQRPLNSTIALDWDKRHSKRPHRIVFRQNCIIYKIV